MIKSERVKLGKKTKKQGTEFQKKVRLDLEKKGYIVSKWSNQVEFYTDEHDNKDIFTKEGKLVQCKAKFNPFTKSVMMMSGGFPDFIAYYKNPQIHTVEIIGYTVIGVESKMSGVLDKEEKENCKWLLDNKIFSKILIAKKGLKRGEILYDEFTY